MKDAVLGKKWLLYVQTTTGRGDSMEGVKEIDITEAAQRLRFSWHRAWRAVLTGRLTARRVGRSWRVDAASVERLRQALLVLDSNSTRVHEEPATIENRSEP